jgi:hypothetical protein
MATIAIEAPPPFFGASLSVIFVSIFRIAENRVRISERNLLSGIGAGEGGVGHGEVGWVGVWKILLIVFVYFVFIESVDMSVRKFIDERNYFLNYFRIY